MSNNINIKNIIIFFLAIFVAASLAVAAYLVYEIRRLPLLNAVCEDEDLQNLKPIDKNRIYVNYFQESDGSVSFSYLYNQFLFCKLFTGEKPDDLLKKLVKNPDGLPTTEETTEWFYRMKILADIFRIRNCSSSESLKLTEELLRFLPPKAFSAGPRNLCDVIIKSDIESEIINKNCDSAGCKAFLSKNIEYCYQMDDLGMRGGCLDSTRYMKALIFNDKNYCREINQGFPKVACESYFIDNKSNMCDAIANEIYRMCKK